LNTPKKPGSDLAALKARLAKKAGDAGAGDAAPEAAPAAPEPSYGGGGEPEAEAYTPAAAAPAPVYTPPAAAPRATSDEPFAGGGSFDPGAGIIDSGPEVAPRGSKGLAIVAAAGAMAFGVAVGYLLNSITSKQTLVDTGKAKGAAMVTEVQAVADARKSISLAMEDVKKTVAADPGKGSEALLGLLDQHFKSHPKVSDLFGWQLASVNATGVRKVFELYEEATGLQTDMGYLAGFLKAYGPALAEAGGPAVFGVLSTGNTVKLVELVAPVCDMATKTPCEGDSSKAQGYLVRDAVGAEPVAVPKGMDKGQALPLGTDGLFSYAVGLEPGKNAAKVYGMLLNKVTERLESMNKAESLALTALKNYADSPTVDDSTSQPEP
jgi:hypothetical protein